MSRYGQVGAASEVRYWDAMVSIRHLYVQGYRAIAEAIELRDLGPYVALYGDNAVGKSSVLLALDLLGRLCAWSPKELLGTGEPWDARAFYERFGQDPWMFNERMEQGVALSATTSSALTVGFSLRRAGDGISVTLTACRSGDQDLCEALERVNARIERQPEGEPPIEAHRDREILYARIAEMLAPLRVALGASPQVPVPDPIRAKLFQAMSASDPRLRARVRAAFRRFRDLFPSLGEGEIDLLSGAMNRSMDLAWVTPKSTIPLDRLGGGVQSVVSSIATLVLAPAPIVAVEEPEAFVGTLALAKLAILFGGAARDGLCAQVWIATHAVTLVEPDDPIVILERADGVVTVRQGKALELGRYAQPAPEPAAERFGRLGQDGSVRLPRAIIERSGLRTGDFVYFRLEDATIHILTGEQLDASLEEAVEP